MSPIALVLVVTSAALHSTWNLVLKRNHGGISSYAMMSLVITLCTFHVQFWTPVDVFSLPRGFWLCIVGSIAADFMYSLGLFAAYKRLDMSTAYPMMRSLPIIFTLVITTLLGIGERVSPLACVGMVVVFVGCVLMPLPSFSHFKLSNYLTFGMLFVICAALGTTGYTIFDKLASKTMTDCAQSVAKPLVSVTYYSLRSITLTTSLWTMCLLKGDFRRELIPMFKSHGISVAVAGICAGMTYLLVLIAMNYVSNVSYVQVFRQLALPFGMIAAFIFLKERCTATKLVGVAMILTGLFLCVV